MDDFTATTEAELRLYNPLVTDFMIVVKRGQVDKPQPFNAMIVSDWASQMSHCAFMITEDDGGTKTVWKSIFLSIQEMMLSGVGSLPVAGWRKTATS